MSMSSSGISPLMVLPSLSIRDGGLGFLGFGTDGVFRSLKNGPKYLISVLKKVEEYTRNESRVALNWPRFACSACV